MDVNNLCRKEAGACGNVFTSMSIYTGELCIFSDVFSCRYAIHMCELGVGDAFMLGAETWCWHAVCV